MKKYLVLSLFVSVFAVNQCLAINMNGIAPVNPLDANPSTYQERVNLPSFELKKGSLTRNAIKNQYTIMFNKMGNIILFIIHYIIL